MGFAEPTIIHIVVVYHNTIGTAQNDVFTLLSAMCLMKYKR